MEKWCAENADTPLLTCENVVFRRRVWKSVSSRKLLPLNQDCVAMAARSGSRCPVVSAVSIAALAIIPADVKATSRALFPHP